MGRGSSKADNKALVGLSREQENNLVSLADNAAAERMARSMALGGFGGHGTKKERENAQKEAERLYGSMGQFERAQYDTLKDIADKNGMGSDFSFNDVSAKVTRKVEGGYLNVFADEYALSSNGTPERRWIVNRYEGWNITNQERFSTPEKALDYARKQK